MILLLLGEQTVVMLDVSGGGGKSLVYTYVGHTSIIAEFKKFLGGQMLFVAPLGLNPIASCD